jgi:hypothetical protein
MKLPVKVKELNTKVMNPRPSHGQPYSQFTRIINFTFIPDRN